MTQEEKELLLKDLGARLPYGLIVEATYKDGEGWKVEDRKLKGIYDDGQVYVDCVYTDIENVKPYLRPLSSMKAEEKEFILRCAYGGNHIPSDEIDFYNANHFDYRGLIPMGLALEAPENMYSL